MRVRDDGRDHAVPLVDPLFHMGLRGEERVNTARRGRPERGGRLTELHAPGRLELVERYSPLVAFPESPPSSLLSGVSRVKTAWNFRMYAPTS